MSTSEKNKSGRRSISINQTSGSGKDLAADLEQAKKDAIQSEKKKDDRRRRTSVVMASSMSSEAMRQLVMGTFTNFLADLKEDQSPEERLQAVMTRAKETGMPITKLFEFFTTNTEVITPDEFKTGIQTLSKGMAPISENDLNALINKFDEDKDGTISIAEFKLYCYTQIKSVAWKAEGQRALQSGELASIRKLIAGNEEEKNPTPAVEIKTVYVPEVENENIVKLECGPKVYSTMKLFWRTNTTIGIHLYYQRDLDVITLQTYNKGEHKEMPCLYIKKKEIKIPKQQIDEAIKTALQTNDVRDAAAKIKIEDSAMWEIYAQYIISRLRLPDQMNPFPVQEMKMKLPPLSPRTQEMMPFIVKLSGDAGESLMTEKPRNIQCPPPIPKEVEISVEDFNSALEMLNSDTASIKNMRTSATKMSKLLALSVNAFAGAEKSLHKRQMIGNKKHMKWAVVFTSWIVQAQVKEIRNLLNSSPAYKILLAEQAEKAKKAS